jgi:hypothetical protein
MNIKPVNKKVRIKINTKLIKSSVDNSFFSLFKKLSSSLLKDFILSKLGIYIDEAQKHAKNEGYLLNIKMFNKYSKSIGIESIKTDFATFIIYHHLFSNKNCSLHFQFLKGVRYLETFAIT